jgi:hypothetical protein
VVITSRSRFPSSHNDNQHPKYYVINEWFNRNKSLLLTLCVVSIMWLFLLHLTVPMVQIVPGSISEKFVMLITIALISVIAFSVICKGIAPIALCAIGLTLIYFGILFPSYAVNMVEVHYRTSSHGFSTEQSILNATHGYFFIGIGMVIFSIIIGYKPTLLYIRNRPEPLHIVWEKYPIWHYNTKIVGGYNEPTLALKSLLTDEEKYLLWHYEFVLANIYGSPYLVKPDGYIPKSSTIFRDKVSRKIVGKIKNIYCC